MSISTLFDQKNPFVQARKKRLSPLWKPGAVYVLVRWEEGVACGRMTDEPDGRRIYLRGKEAPPTGSEIEVRVPRITDTGPMVDRWTVAEVEVSGKADGSCSLWLSR